MLSKKVIIKIDGMHCSNCAKRIEENLKNIDGIKSVKVDLDNKNATIKYKDTIDLELIGNTITDLGFTYMGSE